jgi:hypothetical protein
MNFKQEKITMNANPESLIQDLPIVCTLSEEEQARRGEELEDIFKYIQQVQELADGYAFRFPGDAGWARTLTDYITFERDCCAFFTFELVFTPNHGPIWLRVRGGEGVKELIRQNRGV